MTPMTASPSPPPAVSAGAGRALEHPAAADIRLEEVLHALADPMRLMVLRSLAEADREVTCSEIPLPITKSTTTHHFRVLREAGVITQVYRGTSKMNALRRADLDTLFPGLLDGVLAAAGLQDRRLTAAGSSTD